MFGRNDAGEKVVLSRVQQLFVGQRARCHDASDLTTNQSPGLLWVFHLVADSRPKSGADQLLQVVVQLVVREPGHRDRLVRRLIPSCQRQAQHFGGGLCVFVKQFVEIAHTEQQQRPRVLLAHLKVLLHHGREFCHAPARLLVEKRTCPSCGRRTDKSYSGRAEVQPICAGRLTRTTW